MNIFFISADNNDDDQPLKTPGEQGSTNLFLYNVSAFFQIS